MAKQYGLILSGLKEKEKNVPSTSTKTTTTQPSIFNSENSDSDNEPEFKMRSKIIPKSSITERRMVKKLQEKALAEDASVFQYDEVYDDIKNQRNAESKTKTSDSIKSKYIERLLIVAERRKLENELRIERQVQKERELEGEEFKEKEKFVTDAYKKKLEEMRKLAQSEKHEEYLEAIGDVTKQKDLGGFYRHLYEQKLGTDKNKQESNGNEMNVKEISYKPLKPEKEHNHRIYRKRHHVEEKERPQEETTTRAHLENNFDADSDFSIDSSSSEEDECVETKKQELNESSGKQKVNTAIAINIEKKKENNIEEKNKDVTTESCTEIKKPRIEKKNIWNKRTVGSVFESALQRYYDRKSRLITSG